MLFSVVDWRKAISNPTVARIIFQVSARVKIRKKKHINKITLNTINCSKFFFSRSQNFFPWRKILRNGPARSKCSGKRWLPWRFLEYDSKSPREKLRDFRILQINAAVCNLIWKRMSKPWEPPLFSLHGTTRNHRKNP